MIVEQRFWLRLSTVQHDWNRFGVYGTVGLEFALSALLGLFAGQWLDKRLGTSPWLSLVGLGLGSAAGLRALIRTSNQARRELKQDADRQLQERRKYHDRGKTK